MQEERTDLYVERNRLGEEIARRFKHKPEQMRREWKALDQVRAEKARAVRARYGMGSGDGSSQEPSSHPSTSWRSRCERRSPRRLAWQG